MFVCHLIVVCNFSATMFSDIMSDQDTACRDIRIPVLLLLTWVVAVAPFVFHTREQRDRGDSIGYLDYQQGRLTLTRERPSVTVGLEPHLAALVSRRVPVNKAEAAVLETVPGIGPELARRIVAAREQGGVFVNGADLVRVSGIGDKRARQFQRYLTFD